MKELSKTTKIKILKEIQFKIKKVTQLLTKIQTQ